ncbi:MAG: TatD family hydrolase [Candidatus Omnitrophica bacterium]|nr:TatD family hydrolase [Candidatus Omnitrophota bacterium]
MKLIDTHAHLDQIENLDRVLEAADQEGVESIVTVSVDLASCRKNLDIKKAAKAPHIYLALGMHPSDIDLEDLDACVELIRKEKSELVAIGEIGLDFWYQWVRKDSEKKDAQRKVFRTFLSLAKELDLPAIVHSRGTWRESFEMVRQIGLRKCEFHWYSGPLDVLKDILDGGYYISASPSLAYSPPSREAVHYAPMDRVMMETDSPVFYRMPDGGKEKEADEGFLAEPKDVFRTLKAYCQLKNVGEIDASEILNRNAREFFHLK